MSPRNRDRREASDPLDPRYLGAPGAEQPDVPARAPAEVIADDVEDAEIEEVVHLPAIPAGSHLESQVYREAFADVSGQGPDQGQDQGEGLEGPEIDADELIAGLLAEDAEIEDLKDQPVEQGAQLRRRSPSAGPADDEPEDLEIDPEPAAEFEQPDPDEVAELPAEDDDLAEARDHIAELAALAGSGNEVFEPLTDDDSQLQPLPPHQSQPAPTPVLPNQSAQVSPSAPSPDVDRFAGEWEQTLSSEPPKVEVICDHQAVPSGQPFLPLFDPNDPDLPTLLAHAIAPAEALTEGQEMMVSFDLRRDPNFKAKSQQWITQQRTGVVVEPPRSSAIAKGLKWTGKISWFLAKLAAKQTTGLGGNSQQKKQPKPPKDGPPVLDETDKAALKDAQKKAAAPAFFASNLHITAAAVCDPEQEQLTRDYLTNMLGSSTNSFASIATATQQLAWKDNSENGIDVIQATDPDPAEIPLLLSNVEQAALMHPPDDNLGRTSVIQFVRNKLKPLIPKVAPFRVDDRHNPPAGIVPLGHFPNEESDSGIGMDAASFDQHAVLTGSTGTGKSTLMEWIIFGWIKARYPTVVIDPHGVLGELVLKAIVKFCPERINDVLFIDPSEFIMAYNPFDIQSKEEVDEAVDAALSMLGGREGQDVIDRTNTPRAYNYAKNAARALCYANLYIKDKSKKNTPLHLMHFFDSDGLGAEYRHMCIEFCDDASVLKWYDQDHGSFELLTPGQRAEQTDLIVRAFQTLRDNEQFATAFVGPNKLDFSRLIGEDKIVICKMARQGKRNEAKMGEMVAQGLIASLLGSMDRWTKGCRVAVDEAPKVLKGVIEQVLNILDEARKWDLGLLLAAQYMKQFPDRLREGILTNAKTKIALQGDAATVAGMDKAISDVATTVTPEMIADLDNYQGYANVFLNRKQATGPMAIATEPSPVEGINDDQEYLDIRAEVLRRTEAELGVDDPADAVRKLQGLNLLMETTAELNRIYKTMPLKEEEIKDFSGEVEHMEFGEGGKGWNSGVSGDEVGE